MQLPQPAPGFDQPVDMLLACHARILRQCDTLMRLAEHLGTKGKTAEARTAAQQVYRYFSTSGRYHHEDEEQGLFPALLACRPELAVAISELAHDHREMSHRWAQLEPSLLDIGSVFDTAAFSRDVLDFRTIYAAHIERENTEILPIARQALSAGQFEKLGQEMARRRGVNL